MKRENRQHGLVRTNRILPDPWSSKPDSRFVTKLDSFPTAGLFTQVSPRPTNHSKFTGRCGKARCNECHMQPVSKARDKTKGTHKMKCFDVVSNYRLVTWRVVGGQPGFRFSGFSASGILDHLAGAASGNYLVQDHDDDEDDDDVVESTVEIRDLDGGDDHLGDDVVVIDDDDDDDKMGFCEVGFVLDHAVEGDEGWCYVQEL